ncbi:MAG: gamma-glutamyl-gamma-aminobutyrate hydrolase family protein, partial [Bdellovibrionota bacterium]
MEQFKIGRPRIGITGPDGGGWPAWISTAVAVYRAGGWPVRIRPSHPCKAEDLEGLILGGGADVDPQLYNEKPVLPQLRRQMRREARRRWTRQQRELILGYAALEADLGFWSRIGLQISTAWTYLNYKVNATADFVLVLSLWLLRKLLSLHWLGAPDWLGRDDLEVPLTRSALANGLPILGICRGMQLINVCLGGTLYQEIAEFYEEQPQLTTLLPRKKIEIEPGSRLHEVFGRTMTRVNSLHFQSVKDLGRDLHVSALEPTGVVQAIEHREACFLIGVQWHPEYLALEPRQQRLFRALVAAAITNRSRPKNVVVPATHERAMGEIGVAHPHAPPLTSDSSD